MKALLRYFAKKALSEQIDPHGKGFFQKRFVEDSLTRYNFARRYVKNKTVLDIACGDGYGSYLLSKTANKVIGVDVASDVIKHAVKTYCFKNPHIEFACGDAIEFLVKTNMQFDVVISLETLEHIRDYRQFIRLLRKRLIPGGVLILSTPNRRFTDMFLGIPFNKYHIKEFYTRELVDVLEHTFYTRPKIYRQRSISKKHLFLSAIKSFVVHKKSNIVGNNPSISGLDNIFVIMKK